MTPSLYLPGETNPTISLHWTRTTHRDPAALSLFDRHYSANPRTRWARWYRSGFAGPGQSLTLISADGRALFLWRHEMWRRDGQKGINCAVFRNEGQALSSTLITEAMGVAWNRWPGARLFTFINTARIQSANPGYCFKQAGWHYCGQSKSGLHILEVAA